MKTIRTATKKFKGPTPEGSLLRVQLVTYEVPAGFFEEGRQRWIVESFWLRRHRLQRTTRRFDGFVPAATTFNRIVKKFALDKDSDPAAP